jgi:hypothetical protein
VFSWAQIKRSVSFVRLLSQSAMAYYYTSQINIMCIMCTFCEYFSRVSNTRLQDRQTSRFRVHKFTRPRRHKFCSVDRECIYTSARSNSCRSWSASACSVGQLQGTTRTQTLHNKSVQGHTHSHNTQHAQTNEQTNERLPHSAHTDTHTHTHTLISTHTVLHKYLPHIMYSMREAHQQIVSNSTQQTKKAHLMKNTLA